MAQPLEPSDSRKAHSCVAFVGRLCCIERRHSGANASRRRIEGVSRPRFRSPPLARVDQRSISEAGRLASCVGHAPE